MPERKWDNHDERAKAEADAMRLLPRAKTKPPRHATKGKRPFVVTSTNRMVFYDYSYLPQVRGIFGAIEYAEDS